MRLAFNGVNNDIDNDGILNVEDGDIDGDNDPNISDDSPYGQVNVNFNGNGDNNLPNEFEWYQNLPAGQYEIIITVCNPNV